jgi:transposase
LYFGDGSHFGLTPCVPYAWQHKNNPILLPSAKGQSISVFGIMSHDCKFFYESREGTLNSDKVIEVIDKFAQTIVKRTVLVIDNAPIHKSKKFMKKIKEWEDMDLWIYFLPPYSPELNLIEILWRFIKYQWLNFGAYSNFQNLKEHLNEILNNIGSKYSINYC